MNLQHIKTTFFVNLKLCVIEMLSNRTRAFITSLGIFLGIASLLVNLAFIRGMDDNMRENMEQIGGLNILTVQQKEPVSRKEKMEFQHSPGLSVHEAREIAEKIPSLKEILLYKDLSWQRIKGNGKRSHGKAIAVTPEYLKIFNYSVGLGRFFSDEDFVKKKYVCVIGKRLKERLFGKVANPIGETILIRNIPVTVIGIIKTDQMRNVRSSECLFPFSVYASRFENAMTHLENISFVLKNSNQARQAQVHLINQLKAHHRGVEDFEIEASLDKIKEMENASMGIKIVLWAIGAISLIVGGISIMNIMFATIGDRIREIGIRKTLGAHRYDIFTQFMIEAIFVCFLGGVPGIILGASITFAPENLFPYIPRLTQFDFSLAFGFMISSGIISGLFPALKAAGMQPVEALQY